MSAAQQIMILFNQDLDSSTVRPDLEKFIKNKQTAAHTTAATVAIPATSLYTVCIAFLAVSKIPAANAGDAETANQYDCQKCDKRKTGNQFHVLIPCFMTSCILFSDISRQ